MNVVQFTAPSLLLLVCIEESTLQNKLIPPYFHRYSDRIMQISTPGSIGTSNEDVCKEEDEDVYLCK